MKNYSALYDRLTSYLRGLGPAAVAFSGGTDSTLLLRAACDAGVARPHAVIVRGEMTPEREIILAKDYCIKNNIDYTIHALNMMASADFIENTPQRCYYCKKTIFNEILRIALSMNIPSVIEGSHVSDTTDFRPGIRALRELGIISPFIETGIDKAGITAISRQMAIDGWDRPPGSCLATRIPYGTPVTVQALSMIGMAEEFLLLEGFRQVRVRAHGSLARIEVESGCIERLLSPAMRSRVATRLREIGFDYVALDIEGYRQGSMNINVAELNN